jgi:hypothetical protein
MAKRGPRTAAELIDELSRNLTYRSMRRQQDKLAAEKKTAERIAAAPVLQALRSAGIHVESVWDLVNTSADYRPAVPVLLEHLQRPYPPDVLEGIARSLAVPHAKQGWPVIVAAFRDSPDNSASGVKGALANTLSAIADAHVATELIALVLDASHGSSRIFLLRALGRIRTSASIATLEALRDDPVLGLEARRVFKTLKRRS